MATVLLVTANGEVEVETFQKDGYWAAAVGDDQTDGWMTEDRAVKAISRLLQLKAEIVEANARSLEAEAVKEAAVLLREQAAIANRTIAGGYPQINKWLDKWGRG